YVFDEGHHLPDKAISHFAHHTRMGATADWLDQLDKNLTKLLAQHPLPGDFGRLLEQVPQQARELRPHQQFMAQALGEVADFASAEDGSGQIRPQYRFEHGVVPEQLREMSVELKGGFGRISDLLQRLVDLLKDAMDGEVSVVHQTQAEEWYPLFGAMDGEVGGVHLTEAEEWCPLCGSLQDRAEATGTLGSQCSLVDPEDKLLTARCMPLTEQGDLEVHVSPILAANTLRQYLWHTA